jgi:hypothetical protein
MSKYREHALDFRFSIFARETSTPNTNRNCASFHFDKSPARPTAKSMSVLLRADTLVINIRFTYLLWKSRKPFVNVSDDVLL